MILQPIPKSDYLAGNFLYADGEPPSKKWTFVSFQYGNRTYFPSLQTLKDETKTYDYFPRWNVEDTAKGYHWKMYDLQGKNNLWFIGGGLSFESVHNVMGYNQLLLDKMELPHTNCNDYHYKITNPFYLYGKK